MAEFARRQHGVITASQLAALGIRRRGIAHRVRHGRLTPLHRGVYLVGPLKAPLTDIMAAVLACGPAAAVSHRAAAALHGFAPEWRGPIDVTVANGQPRTRPGLTIHRKHLAPHEVAHARNIPVTTPARTIRDVATTTTRTELQRLIEEAQIQRKLDHSSLADAVDQARGTRGARALRAAAATAEPTLTRSEAERRLLRLIREAGLPAPITNARVGGYEVDALWARQRLIVEVDGFTFHSSRSAFERDRRRDAELLTRGHRVIRVTWRQLVDEPHALVARLAVALASG